MQLNLRPQRSHFSSILLSTFSVLSYPSSLLSLASKSVSMMFSCHNFHWYIPTVIISCFLAGLICAVGHHSFYQSLDGNVVHSSSFVSKLHVSSQRFNIAIGNVFATLVASFLATVISAVYIQLVWRSIRAQPTKLALVDTLFYANKSPTAVLSVDLWRKHYGLAILALAFWYDISPFTSIQ
jgi:hypothetical protein